MRKAFLGVLITVLFTLNLEAANTTGRWSGQFRVEGGDHDIPQLILIKQEGNKITGSGGPNESEQYPIEKGSIDGDHVQFELTTGDWKFAYDLKIDDAKMMGKITLNSLNESRSAKVSLTKVQ